MAGSPTPDGASDEKKTAAPETADVTKSPKASVLSASSPAFVPKSTPDIGAVPWVPINMPAEMMDEMQFYPLSHITPAASPAFGAADPSLSPSFAPLSGSPILTGGPVFTDLDARLLSILKQIEFYFSDSNLWKDRFLQREIKKSPERWVTIQTIADFNRMKKITSDFNEIVCALRQSQKLEVSEDGLCVRRIRALPPPNKKKQNKKTIYVENLPKNTSIDTLHELFSKFGEVVLVEMSKDNSFAFIEYSGPAMAKNALAGCSKDPGCVDGIIAISKGQYLKAAQNVKEKTRDVNNWRLDSGPAQPAQTILGNLKEKRAESAAEKTVRREKLYAFENIEAKGRPPRLALALTKRKKTLVKQPRLAKGPDGTRGFGAGRGRPINP